MMEEIIPRGQNEVLNISTAQIKLMEAIDPESTNNHSGHVNIP